MVVAIAGSYPAMLNAEQYIDYMVESQTLQRTNFETAGTGVTNTAWTDVAFDNSQMQSTMYLSPTAERNGNYYLSLTYLDNNGIVKGRCRCLQNVLRQPSIPNMQSSPGSKWETTNQIEKFNIRSVSMNNEYGSLLTSILQLDPLTPDTYAADKLPAHMQTALNNGKHLLKNENGDYYAVSKYYAGEQFHPYDHARQ